MKILFWLLRALSTLIRVVSPHKRGATLLRISAGERGWHSIEFKELLASGQEWLGPDLISTVTRKPGDTVGSELESCSHFFYDPRTADDGTWSCYTRAIKVALIAAWRDVVPIGYLTDASFRRWRIACFLATADSGTVVALMSSLAIPRAALWHRRFSGPSPMALSSALSARLEKKRFQDRGHLIAFSGSLYSRRKTFFAELSAKCREQNFQLEIRGRDLGGMRISDAEYWGLMLDAKFVVTTSDQLTENELDFPHVKQLLYRFSEATLAGACLISNIPEGAECCFRPGIHYVSADSPDDVVAILRDFEARPEFYEQVADQGRRRTEALISSMFFWNAVNSALGTDRVI
jgi:hypothetical protein